MKLLVYPYVIYSPNIKFYLNSNFSQPTITHTYHIMHVNSFTETARDKL